MRERRSLLKCCLKISRLPDSSELTNCNIVVVWTIHGLMTAPRGARSRVLRPERIPNGFECLNSAAALVQQAQGKREFLRSSRHLSQLQLRAKRCDALSFSTIIPIACVWSYSSVQIQTVMRLPRDGKCGRPSLVG